VLTLCCVEVCLSFPFFEEECVFRGYILDWDSSLESHAYLKYHVSQLPSFLQFSTYTHKYQHLG
jgi:hypothetical protein